jgi:hypothetical protein
LVLRFQPVRQQYFSIRTNQPPTTSRNQPAVIFSQNKPAPAISHQPTEQWFVLREEYYWLVAAGCWWLVRSERKVLLAGG